MSKMFPTKSILVFWLGLTSFFPAKNVAQSNPPADGQKQTELVPVTASVALSTPPPQNPAEILGLAGRMNGLDLVAASPWHAKFTWDQFDEDGDNSHSGTYEEFYANPKKYRRIYSGDTLNQVEVANSTGLYRSGDQRWPNIAELEVRNAAIQPFYSPLDGPQPTFEKIDWSLGKSKMACVILRFKTYTASNDDLPKYCFVPGTVLLRYKQGMRDETAYNSLILFQGRYVARDVTVTKSGRAFLKIHLEELESVTPDDDAMFNPPSGNSGRISGRISLPSGQFSDHIISQPQPQYPRGVRGQVNVKFVVGKDGRVLEAEALDGPAEMRKPAVDAMRKWTFHPYLVLDDPVEVESTMIFTVQ